MALPSTISGAAWPTSGNVTTGNSGFYNVAATAGKLTYKAFGAPGAVDAAPPGCTSASYIEYDTQGVAATAGFYQSDWTEVATAITTGAKIYEQEFFFQIAKTNNFVSTTTPANSTAFYFATIGNVYAGFNIICINSATDGEGFIYRQITGSIPSSTTKGFSSCEGPTTGEPVFLFDTWYRGKIRFKGGTSGYYQFWVNGRLVGQTTGDMSGLVNLQFAFALPANVSTFPSGLKMRFAGPMKASNAAITSIVDYALDTRKQHCVKDLPVRFQGADGENRWTTSTSGSITKTITDWGIAGNNPGRYYASFSGTAAASETWNSEKLYDPTSGSSEWYPFNDEGWTTVRVINFKMTGSTRSTLLMEVYDKTNATAEIGITLDASGNIVKNSTGATLFSSLAVDNNYCLLIHISTAGEVYMTLFDQTNTTFSATSIQSVYYGSSNIRVDGIGKFKCTLTLGNSGNPTMDGIQLLKWATIPIVDSYTHSPAYSVTPNLANKTNINKFRDAEEKFSLPGGYSPRVYGSTEDCVIGAIAGRSGQALSTFYTYLANAFANSRGIRLMQMCGLVNNYSTSPTMNTTNYSNWVDYTCNLARSLVANRNRFWWTSTPVPPGDGGANNIPTSFKNAVPLYNAATLATLSTLGYLVETSDIYSAVSSSSITWDGIGIHPSTASNLTLWRSIGTVRSVSLATITDSFVGDSINLTDHLTDQGASWVKNTTTNGRIKLTGGGYIRNDYTGSSLYHPLATPSSNQYSVAATFTYYGEPTGAYLGLRCLTTSYDGYFAGYQSNAWRIIKVVAGVSTTLGSVACALNRPTSYNVVFSVSNSSSNAVLSLTVDGVEVLNVTDTTSVISRTGYAGLKLHNVDNLGTSIQLSSFYVTSVNDSISSYNGSSNGNESTAVDCLVFDGDSLTYGRGTDGTPNETLRFTYPARTAELLSNYEPTAWVTQAKGAESKTWTTLTSGAAANIDTLKSGSNYTAYFLIAQAGANDILAGDSADTIYTNLKAYCTARRAAGWSVGIGTMLGCTSSSYPVTFNDIRNAVNTLIRANWTGFADFLVDFASDPDIGADTSPDNTKYFSTDKLNVNNLGARKMADVAYAALSAYKTAKAITAAGGQVTTNRKATRSVRLINWSKFLDTNTSIIGVSVQRRNQKDVIVVKHAHGANTSTLFTNLAAEVLSKTGYVLSTYEVVFEDATASATYKTRSRQAYPGTSRIRKSLPS